MASTGSLAEFLAKSAQHAGMLLRLDTNAKIGKTFRGRIKKAGHMTYDI
jgi:hypothetical protein